VFVSSAAAAAGGMAMVTTAPVHAGPARRLAAAGAVFELAASTRMERTMGLSAQPLHHGRAGRYTSAARALTAVGAALVVVPAARRSRLGSALAGVSLLAGSAATRFGIFHAGQQSALDPRYTVVPQRERLG
jgi:hypothetical protein